MKRILCFIMSILLLCSASTLGYAEGSKDELDSDPFLSCIEEDNQRGSYHHECPVCQTTMIRCCNEHVQVDDYELVCPIHSNCVIVQDRYWNYYYCTNCGYNCRGSEDDDYHIEAYYHRPYTYIEDETYCHLPRLYDLIHYT